MVQFHVVTPALSYSAASMTGALADFDAQLASATAAVNAVAGATWTGSAADAFLSEWAQFLEGARETREALASIAFRLQAAQGTYDATESQVTASSRSSNVNATGPGGAAR